MHRYPVIYLISFFVLCTATIHPLSAQVQWTRVAGFIVDGHVLAGNTKGDVFAYNDGGFLERSTDHGTTWTVVDSGLDTPGRGGVPGNISLSAIAFDSTGDVYACSTGGVYRSTNNGTYWTLIDTNFWLANTNSLAIAPNGTLFAGQARVYRSIDHGVHWAAVSPEYIIMGQNGIFSIVVNKEGDVFAASDEDGGPGGVYRSRDNGTTWTRVLGDSLQHKIGIYSLAMSNEGTLYAASWLKRVYRSTDGGATWDTLATNIGFIEHMAINAQGSVFIAGDDHIAVSYDSCKTWMSLDSGLFGYGVFALGIDALGYVYVNIRQHGVYRSGVSTVSVHDQSLQGTTPAQCGIRSVYPNPTGSSANIMYGIPSAQPVRLRLMDVLGRTIATLCNGTSEAGTFNKEIDAAGLQSGVYWLELKTASGVQLKMVAVGK